MTAIHVDRATVLAYRIAAHGLHRTATRPVDLAVTALGVQDTPAGTAAQAIAARTTAPLADDLADGLVTLTWSTRGAPHVHRTGELPAIAAALWPLNDADARSRISSSRIKEGARLGIEAFRVTASAMHDVVTKPMAKGDVSGAVTARIPATLSFDCPVCASTHLSGALFQQVGLAAGTRLVPGATPTTLAPIDSWPGVPEAAAGTADLVLTYLRLHGPATDAEAAALLGTTRTHLRPVWSAELVEIDVEGRTAWLPEDAVDALRTPPEPPDLRLLPAGDPFLQARDRTLLVPDAARHGQVWKVLGNPGVLLVDGDITGVWRAKLAGKRLDVAVTAFEPIPDSLLDVLDDEANRLAELRSATAARVTISA